jgi:hypothetical protein
MGEGVTGKLNHPFTHHQITPSLFINSVKFTTVEHKKRKTYTKCAKEFIDGFALFMFRFFITHLT